MNPTLAPTTTMIMKNSPTSSIHRYSASVEQSKAMSKSTFASWSNIQTVHLCIQDVYFPVYVYIRWTCCCTTTVPSRMLLRAKVRGQKPPTVIIMEMPEKSAEGGGVGAVLRYEDKSPKFILQCVDTTS